jgi:hypothetical protein
MKTVTYEGYPKSRSWMLVKDREEEIAVKVSHAAGREQRSIMARERKGAELRLFWSAEIIGLITDKSTIRRLQKKYYSKKGRR